jgi:hemophore-related protein
MASAAIVAVAGVPIAGVAAADVPPNCTGADYAAITAGVATSMSGYLFSHPDVNAYVTNLQATSPTDQSALRLAQYEADHPQVRAEIAAIRQPLVDFDQRCGYGPHQPLDFQTTMPQSTL